MCRLFIRVPLILINITRPKISICVSSNIKTVDVLASSHFDHLCMYKTSQHQLQTSCLAMEIISLSTILLILYPTRLFRKCVPLWILGVHYSARLWNHCRDVQGWKHQWYSCLHYGICIFLHPKDINYCSFLIQIKARAHHIKMFFFSAASCSYAWYYKAKLYE